MKKSRLDSSRSVVTSLLWLVFLTISLGFAGYQLSPYIKSTPWYLLGLYIALAAIAFHMRENVLKLKSIKGLKTEEYYQLEEICEAKSNILKFIFVGQLVTAVFVIGGFASYGQIPKYSRYILGGVGMTAGWCIYNAIRVIIIQTDIGDFNTKIQRRIEKQEKKAAVMDRFNQKST